MYQAFSNWLVDLPAVADLIFRATVVLSVAWLCHSLLRRYNSRWRVQLWRFTSLSIVAVFAAGLLPKLAIVVPADVNGFAASGYRGPPLSFGAAAFDEPLDPGLFESRLAATTMTYPADGMPAVADEWNAPHVVAESGSEQWSLRFESWKDILALVWWLGSCVFLLRWALAQRRVRQLIAGARSFSISPEQIIRLLDGRTFDFDRTRVLLSNETDVPFVAGIRCPVIVLPGHMTAAEFSDELPAVLGHELSHVESRDLFWSGVLQSISMILWFHPLAWKIRTAHDMACEEVADSVAAGSVGGIASYSSMLARVALGALTQPPTETAMSMARSSQIMSRLTRLKQGVSNEPLAGSRVAVSVLIGVLVLFPLVGLAFVRAEQDPPVQHSFEEDGPVRVLQFPANRTVGMLYVLTDGLSVPPEFQGLFDRDYYRTWQYIGPAQGQVTVPADCKVKLALKADGARDMSWVRQLKADDIYELFVYSHPSDPKRFLFGDQQVAHLGHLSGLRRLEMKYVQVTGRGLKELAPMKSLECLRIYSPELGNPGLRSIGRLTALKVLSLGKMKWDDQGLVHLADLKLLEEINLPHQGRPGVGFKTVTSLPRLRFISAGTAFNDRHLAELRGMKSLTTLSLTQCAGVTDAGLRHLAALPGLKSLNLLHTNVTDAGVQNLRDLKSLEYLGLHVKRYLPDSHDPAITAASAKLIAEMPSLQYLDLTNVGGANEFLAQISHMKQLKSLQIGGFRTTGLINDAGAGHIAKLTNLQSLLITGTEITDKGMKSLSRLHKLERLNLQSDNVTDEGIAQLAKLSQLRDFEFLCGPKRGGTTFGGASRLNGLRNLKRLWYSCRRPTGKEPALDLSNVPALEDFCMGWIRDQDLAGLANCRKLKRLQIGDQSRISNAGLARLSDLTSMEVLLLSGDGITDEGLVHLANMKRLFSLNLRGHITDSGLRHLEGLHSLTGVTLYTQDSFTSEGLDRLQRHLPGLASLSVDQNRVSDSVPVVDLKVGQVAPPFRAESLAGKELSLESFRGKVLLLYFWSTSCPPCVASVPKIKESVAELNKYRDFEMVSLSGDGNESLLRSFVRKHRLSWPQIRIGEDSRIAADYGVTGYPTYILVGRDGRILCVGAQRLDAELRKALEIDTKS